MTHPNPTGRPALHLAGPDDANILTPHREPGRIRTSWTADDLMAMVFPPPNWAVPGIIAEGVNLLAGPPKVGKSWLSLGLGIAVAAGGKAFDSIPVPGGPVLYLALEDTPRRLQTRMGKILGGQPAPKSLTLATTCPPMNQGGDEAIAAWLDRHRDARMVIIDVFAKIRGQSAPGASAYDADYAAVGRIKKVADAYGIAIVLVHHVRKAGSEDFLEAVSGTNGIAGAADATLVLRRPRGQADGVLHVTGRDVDESEYALGFQPASGTWRMLDGPAQDHTLTDTRATILFWLRNHGAAGPRAIADGSGLNYDTVKKTCQRMLANSQLACDPSGHYSVPVTGDSAGSVPGVPGVPVSGLSWEDSLDLGGHPGDSAESVPAVPAVPVRSLSWENSSDLGGHPGDTLTTGTEWIDG